MNSEIVAIYHYTNKPDSTRSSFEILACYDSWEDYDKRNVSHYDIYNKFGVCVNEGDPWYELPSWHNVAKYYRSSINGVI